MIKIEFKNVGQGDSIILEWESNSEKKIGIIDCNKYEGANPILDHIIINQLTHIDFIILSHFHFDHYSGFSELFEYLIENNITVGIFLHTLTADYLHIFDLLNNDQISNQETRKFVKLFNYCQDNDIFIDYDEISNNFKHINLGKQFKLKFLSPLGSYKKELGKQRHNYLHKRTIKKPDFNIVSTIINIYSTETSILLTSDSVKKAFAFLMSKNVFNNIALIQVPHHGSIKNHLPAFWDKIISQNIPAVFSVGDSAKDKLPNVEVVEYFNNSNFKVISTNCVYGINDVFNCTKKAKKNTTTLLNSFSKLKKKTSDNLNKRFNGSKVFVFKN